MRTRIGLAVLCLVLVPGGAAFAQDITIEFRVAVPPDTPGDAMVYLAGSLPAAGGWNPGAVRLERRDDGRWGAKLLFPRGRNLEYKFTLGSWVRAEKDKTGREIANRVLQLERDDTVEVTVERWADGADGPTAAGVQAEHTRTGIFEHHADFPSQYLTQRRDVLVYLPPGYHAAENASVRYPVLYMHDGQNLFDAATSFARVEWRLDETAEQLIREGRIVPIIVVGIYNTPARMTEYTYGAEPRPAGRSGEDYVRFLVEELKPFIDQTYRTRPDRRHTAIGGSSLGGLISLYAASTRPEVFSMAGVVSPALFWGDARAIRDVPRHAPYPSDMKFWVDIGTEEGGRRQGESVGSAVTHCRDLITEFKKAGLVEGANYRYLEVPGAGHSESYWSQRVDQMLLYFFANHHVREGSDAPGLLRRRPENRRPEPPQGSGPLERLADLPFPRALIRTGGRAGPPEAVARGDRRRGGPALPRAPSSPRLACRANWLCFSQPHNARYFS